MNAKDDLKQYYKTFELHKVKNRKNVENELMYQLFKKPIEKDVPVTEPEFKNHVHQYDLLFLPHDRKMKYAVVGVDVGSRLCDAEPIPNKQAQTVLNAVLKMYDRGILETPLKVKVDFGSEFKSVFAKYMKDHGVDMVVAQPNRHRQIALVETRNQAIGNFLMKNMVLRELQTGKKNVEWVEYLPTIVKRLNKRYQVKNPHPNDKMGTQVYCKGNDCELLQEGQEVRYALDRPIDIVTGKAYDKKFRSSDVRFSLEPTKIKVVRLSAVNPPLYALEGKKAFYTKSQLLPIDGKSNIPEEGEKEIEKIVMRKKIKNRIQFHVKFKGKAQSFNEWIPRTELIKTHKSLVQEYEKNH